MRHANARMPDFPFDTVLFDLDGTLLETHRDLGAAVNHALEIGGFDPVPADSASDLIGGGAKVMLGQAIDAQGGVEKDEFRALYKAMLGFYEQHNAVHTRPYAHALEVLDELKSFGVALGVVTNKFEGFARSILTELGLIDRFAVVVGGDTIGKDEAGNYIAKPSPEPILHARKACGGGRAVFVGDSSYDVKAARSAQVPVVAAMYGYCDGTAGELAADAAIESLSELVATLRRM